MENDDTQISDKSVRMDSFREDMSAMGRTDTPIFCDRCRGRGIDPWDKKICQDCGGYGYLNPLI